MDQILFEWRRPQVDWKRIIRKHGVTLASMFLLFVWTVTTCAITAHNVRAETEERLAAEYEAKLLAYIEEQREAESAKYFLSGEASREAAINQEADAIARVIGTMNTKRQKRTMIWNILTRVDNPAYPGTVQEVIAQPQQWMFYDENNPIREDDRQLALEQLQLWHEGRYPAGLTTGHVYGEWSTNDYVLRDSWEKNSRTDYWRAEE